MSEQEILDMLKNANAFLEGHFQLTSGLHSPHYIEKFRILENPVLTETLCKELADNFKDENISLVVGPMTGGIILSYETGKQLGCKAIFTERVKGKMTFKRGFRIKENDKVLIVEDIITTGGSIQEVIEVIKQTGAVLSGISCIVDRSNKKVKFEYPFKPLLTLDVVNYKPDECPLCKEGIPLFKPGSTNK
jgi:orotate phosphoribosyltransferase